MAGLLDRYLDPNVAQRSGILPLARMKDGSMSLAWPGALLDVGRGITYTGDVMSGRRPLTERGVTDAAVELAGGAAGAGLLAGPKTGVNIGMFAGRNAATADKTALKRAQDMADAGAGRDDIWKETGWYKGVDGEWRFEIDDRGAYLSDVNAVPPAVRARDAGESDAYIRREGLTDHDQYMVGQNIAGHHPRMFDAYPHLKDTMLSRRSGSIFEEGHFNEKLDNVNVSLLAENPRSTWLHENQHAIQAREGFARGGSPSTMAGAANPRLDKWLAHPVAQRLNKLRNSPEYQDQMDGYNALYRNGGYEKRADDLDFDDPDFDQKLAAITKEYRAETATRFPLIDEAQKMADELSAEGMPWSRPKPQLSGEEAYLRLAGEAEARNVQTRMDYPSEQRRATPPWETLDVPEDELIVRMFANPATASVPGLLKQIEQDKRNQEWIRGGGA